MTPSEDLVVRSAHLLLLNVWGSDTMKMPTIVAGRTYS